MFELRLRSRIHPDELAAKVGKVLTPGDVSLLVTREARVAKPDGSLLFVYLPAWLPPDVRAAAYPILTTIRALNDNRGLASGSTRVIVGRQNRAAHVRSNIIGAFEPLGARIRGCRQTAWTGAHPAEWAALTPVWQAVAAGFAQYVPQRYAAQQAVAAATHPAWVIPGTPFSTVTVNNTYATGVHKDAGDLPEGYSCMAVLRRGAYTGGALVFPEYRVGVDLQDGDLLLMDPHEWHGNVALALASPDAERISVVLYYRTKLRACGAPAEELARAKRAGGTLAP